MSNQVLLSSYTLDELKSLISECLSNQLDKPKQETEQVDLIKIDEVCAMLKVSKVTIWDWKRKGIIPFHRLANKVFFKRNEIIEALNKIERKKV